MHVASSPFRKFLVGNLSALLAGLRSCVTARELLDTAGGVDELLLASEEGMARRADADFDVALRGTGVIDGATRAGDRGVLVVGMNICFHGSEKGVGDYS